jgi:hypothetical protein
MNKHLKLITTAAAAAAFAVLIPVAQAVDTAPAGFNVTVNLTSGCEVTSAPTDVAFTYSSFQGSAATSTGGAFSVRCTQNLPYTMALDSTTGTVIGLNYTLTLSAAGGTGAGLTAANHTVNGSMASGQSGICATTGVCVGTSARTLTVSY